MHPYRRQPASRRRWSRPSPTRDWDRAYWQQSSTRSPARCCTRARRAATAIPASTTKIVTGAAVLAELGPAASLTTRVVRGTAADEIVIVGGGDPLLTAVAGGCGRCLVPPPTRLTDLAAQTVSSLRAEGIGSVRVRSRRLALYRYRRRTPRGRAPIWAPLSHRSPRSPSTRRGRRAVDEQLDPPIAAGDAFAAMLGQHGVVVTAPGRAGGGGPRTPSCLAEVRSAPVSRHRRADAARQRQRRVRSAGPTRGAWPAISRRSFDGVAVALPAAIQRLGTRHRRDDSRRRQRPIASQRHPAVAARPTPGARHHDRAFRAPCRC